MHREGGSHSNVMQDIEETAVIIVENAGYAPTGSQVFAFTGPHH